jgi:SAM-dependent methyltransferase
MTNGTPEKEDDMATAAALAKQRTDEWEEVHKVVPWGSVPDHNFQKFVESRWGGLNLRSASFLDLGCGAGAQAIWLAERGYHVTAVDASRAAIERLLERTGRIDTTMPISLMTVTADVRDVSFGDAKFDCVFDVCCLQHIEEDAAVAVVQRARQWLKPGGVFWSKQAIAPFDHTLNRVSYIRPATMESLRRMFVGYAEVKMDMLREIVRGDKNLWSVIVQARVGL